MGNKLCFKARDKETPEATTQHQQPVKQPYRSHDRYANSAPVAGRGGGVGGALGVTSGVGGSNSTPHTTY